MTKEGIYRACAAIVLKKPDGTALLVHKPRARDDWQIPQGGVEEGESIEEAAARELFEETGVNIESTALKRSAHIYQYDYPQSFIEAEHPRFVGQHLTFATAFVPQETKVIVDQDELDAYTWVHPSELPGYLERENYRKVVEAVIAEMTEDGS